MAPLASRCDYCSIGIDFGTYYYRSISVFTDFYCIKCFGEGHASPRDVYRQVVNNGDGEFIRLNYGDYEALVLGHDAKKEEDAVMKPGTNRRYRDEEDNHAED